MEDEALVKGEILELLAGALEPSAPDADVTDRLIAAVSGSSRYLPFCAELAEYFDLPRDRVVEVLSRVDDPSAWTRGIEPIQGFLHFAPGPRRSGLSGGLVRMQPGARVSQHRHVDREVTYVLEGTLSDGGGRKYGPGEAIDMAPGSEHMLRVEGDEPAVIALLHGRLEMLG